MAGPRLRYRIFTDMRRMHSRPHSHSLNPNSCNTGLTGQARAQECSPLCSEYNFLLPRSPPTISVSVPARLPPPLSSRPPFGLTSLQLADANELSTATSTMRRASHPSGCARCGAGAGRSAIKYQPPLPETCRRQRALEAHRGAVQPVGCGQQRRARQARAHGGALVLSSSSS